MASNFPPKFVEANKNLNQTHDQNPSVGNCFTHGSKKSDSHGQSTVYTVYRSTFTQGGMYM